MIEYKKNYANHEDIQKHFDACDPEFIKDLSSRVVIPYYIEKILAKADRYEAWCGNDLAGLLAVYSNPEFDFITNVSVAQNFVGQGIASELLKRLLPAEKEIRLEVAKDNKSAHSLYSKFRFKIYDGNETSDFLKLKK